MQPANQPVVLAIDAGTSALKAVLYNTRGSILASAIARYAYQVPQPGWAEADPDRWWQALLGALAQLNATGFDLGLVQVLGVTGQMHTAVLLDEKGRPLEPTILWLDRRAAAETAELQRQLGLPPARLNSTYTLPKLLWLARRRPEVLAQTHTLLWPKDYLRYRLTGQVATDVTEAAGAALYDDIHQTWAIDRLALISLDPAVLPPIRPADSEAGLLRPDVAQALGLSPELKVVVGAGDVIALLGAAPPKAGRLSCSLGSSAMVSALLAANQIIDDPQQRLYVYPYLPHRLLNGVLSTSGASLTWAQEALYGEETAWDSMLATAEAVPPGADNLFFLPFLTGERCPYWSDALRGGFYGLTLSHRRAHMVRAVMEGVAYSLRHLLDIAEELGVPIGEIALAGGGATVAGWPRIIADVCQRPLLIYADQETVTKALYAYCITALDKDLSFDQALAGTFGPPQPVDPRLKLAGTYEVMYRQYRLMADFAAEKLKFVNQNSSLRRT
jgi:xylulokinase